MATKAELETQLAELTAEYEKFRKAVVKEALGAAETYQWCYDLNEILIDLGLGEYLPNEFVVEEKRTSRSKWDFYDVCDTKQEAIESAKGTRIEAVTPWNVFPAQENFSTTIYPESDVEYLVTALREAAKRVKPSAPAKLPAYPKFRAVEKSADGKTVINVLWESE